VLTAGAGIGLLATQAIPRLAGPKARESALC
jgi:hypothetical protein